MKKLLISLSPFFVALFVLMWISWGLKGVLAFFGAILFVTVMEFGLVKWIEFVDEHIND